MICYIVEFGGHLNIVLGFDNLIMHLNSLRSQENKYTVYRIDLVKLTVEKMQ